MKNATLLLRIGLASVFLYAALAAFFDPLSWIGFFPARLRETFGDRVLLMSHSVFEAALALWLISGRLVFLASLAASLLLLAIIVFNFKATDIIFRDVGLLSAAAALAVLSKRS